MIDKKLDNQKNQIESNGVESGYTSPEFSKNTELEKKQAEQAGEKHHQAEHHRHRTTPSKVTKNIRPIPQVQDEVSIKIEKILESGLADEFAKLSPIAKQEFKIKGEETTTKIRELLRGTHIKVKKIFYLIVEWLKILPGINKFFLEQEAKIKTDMIIGLHNKQKEKDLNKIL